MTCPKCRTSRAAIGPQYTRRFDGEWLEYACPECYHVMRVRPYDYDHRTVSERMNDSLDRILGIGTRP